MAVPDSMAESHQEPFQVQVLDLEPDSDQAPEWSEETPDPVDGVSAWISDAIFDKTDVATLHQNSAESQSRRNATR